jgi:uncharacterized membrane protein
MIKTKLRSVTLLIPIHLHVVHAKKGLENLIKLIKLLISLLLVILPLLLPLPRLNFLFGTISVISLPLLGIRQDCICI